MQKRIKIVKEEKNLDNSFSSNVNNINNNTSNSKKRKITADEQDNKNTNKYSKSNKHNDNKININDDEEEIEEIEPWIKQTKQQKNKKTNNPESKFNSLFSFNSRSSLSSSSSISSSKNQSKKQKQDKTKNKRENQSQLKDKEQKDEQKIQKRKQSSSISWDILSEQQKEIVKSILEGKSIFFTGEGGTGKSLLLKYLISILPPETTYVTGSTGLTSVALEGFTLHHFSGIGLGDQPANKLIKDIQSKSYKNPRSAHYRWKTCRVLIVDEISMINGYLWDKLNYIGQKIRENIQQAFGGIQLILSGDGLQLPPVKSDRFIFDAKCWAQCVQCQFNLTVPFRQSDPQFLKALRELRYGMCSLETERLIEESENRILPEINGVLPTHIFTTNKLVRDENQDRLDQLPEKDIYEFNATDYAQDSSYQYNLTKNCSALKKIELKIGAQVMLLYNLDTDRGLCNGTRGIIVKFEPIYESENPWGGKLLVSTIKENIKNTNLLDKTEIKNETKTKTKTEIKSNSNSIINPPGGIYISNLEDQPPPLEYDSEEKKSNENYTERFNTDNSDDTDNTTTNINNDNNHNSTLYLPVVRFENGEQIIIEPFKFESKMQGKTVASRKQIPLMLAWAFNVHRIQGRTLDRAIVDLSGTFTEAQVYVALSRVKTLAGLQVLNFNLDYIRANAKMVEFYRNLTHPI